MLKLKLEAPRPRLALIDRPDLLAALEAGSRARLLVLVAPLGFGKSTLLSQWRQARHRAGHGCAWLSLDEDDADPLRFMIGLILALHASRAGDHAVDVGQLEMLGIDSLLRHAMTFDAGPDPVHIILDDYHRCACPDIDALLRRLIQALPDPVRLVLSSRNRPDLNLPQLVATGVATELNAEALRFSANESRNLLQLSLAGEELDALVDQIEGWPVALQLARVALHEQQILPAAIKQLTGRGGHLSDYLTDQVLRRLPREHVDFLLETAVLDRFNVALADAVRERSDSWAIIDALEPLQSLITPTHGDATWYRYHPLLAEYLRAVLIRSRPGVMQALHQRASRVFEGLGLVAEAVRHAAAAGNPDRCAALIGAAGGWRMCLYGGRSELVAALRCIAPQDRYRFPRVAAADAYLKAKTGDIAGARAVMDRFADPLDSLPDWRSCSEEDRDLLNVSVQLGAYEDQLLDTEFVERCERVRVSIPAEDALTRGVFACEGAVGLLATGRLAEAETVAGDAMTAMRAANSIVGLNYCFLHAAASALYRGRVRETQAYLSKARRMAEENFGRDSGLKSMADMLSNYVELWRSGSLDAASRDVITAFAVARDTDAWFEIYAAALDAMFRAAVLDNDLGAMRATIAAGFDVLTNHPMERLEIIVQAQQLRLLQAEERRPEAQALARDLLTRLPLGAWRRRPAIWRPYQEAGYEIARLFEGVDGRFCDRILSDLIACAAAIGATLFEVRGLALRAQTRQRAGRRADAMADLLRAVRLAAPEDIRLPFLELPALQPLLRGLTFDDAAPHPDDALAGLFVEDLVAIRKGRAGASGTGQDDLSPREIEVAREVARGLTNKEIARVLDMTEHTVKFHLHNIFLKLDVDRRSRVQAFFAQDVPLTRA